jgi:hypothetical protein
MSRVKHSPFGSYSDKTVTTSCIARRSKKQGITKLQHRSVVVVLLLVVEAHTKFAACLLSINFFQYIFKGIGNTTSIQIVAERSTRSICESFIEALATEVDIDMELTLLIKECNVERGSQVSAMETYTTNLAASSFSYSSRRQLPSFFFLNNVSFATFFFAIASRLLSCLLFFSLELLIVVLLVTGKPVPIIYLVWEDCVLHED